MVVKKYLTVLSGKYPANLYRIPDSAGCLNVTGYRIPVSSTSLILLLSCSSVVQIYEFLLYKVWCFIEISSTDKNDNLTCEIIIHDNFSHVKIIAFQLSLFCKNYRFSKTVFYIINRKIHGWLEIPNLFLVLNMTSHLFAALTCEISCSTLEINLVFPRTHVLFSI